MLNDAEMDDLRWKADLIGGCVPVRPEELRELLHEIARLRAELAKSNDARDDDAMTFGNALDRQRAEIDQLSLLLSESREDAARLRAELDRRPDIPADVLSRVEWTVRADRSKGGTFEDMMDVAEALQAHAQKAVKLSPRDREEPTGPWKAVKP